MEYFRKNKLIKKELNLLGDYLFYYNKSFSKDIILNKMKYTRGVKNLLNGLDKSQNEINEFVKKCQNLENCGIEFFGRTEFIHFWGRFFEFY